MNELEGEGPKNVFPFKKVEGKSQNSSSSLFAMVDVVCLFVFVKD